MKNYNSVGICSGGQAEKAGFGGSYDHPFLFIELNQ